MINLQRKSIQNAYENFNEYTNEEALDCFIPRYSSD